MLHSLRENIGACLCNALYATCQKRIPTKLWSTGIVIFTVATTSCMLLCVCTDEWEVITYDFNALQNITLSKRLHNPCRYTALQQLGDNGWYVVKYHGNPPGSSTGAESACQEDDQQARISLALPQRGGAFRLCWDVDEDTWANISALCAPSKMDRCLTYDTQSVKQPFCCVQCLFTTEEVTDLNEAGETTFEPIFTAIGFLIVALLVLGVCHVLAIITLFQRIVPVVLVNGILFLVSGTFMAFCLAAHEYKINAMNTKRRRLPHMTWETISSAKVTTSWSVDVGWMAVALCVVTGTLWIRFSYHLASDTLPSNKVRPVVTIQHSNSVSNPTGNANPAASSPRQPSSPGAPKSVRWAINPQTSTTIVSNSRPNSGSKLLANETPPSATPSTTAVSTPQQMPGTVHPLMVEEPV